MDYVGKIFRPPSEARSLILQVSVGCTHNKCTFCTMYKDQKFYVKDLKIVFDDIEYAKEVYGNKLKKVFLCDGDPLTVKTDHLLKILDKIYETFPYCEQVSTYAAPYSSIIKTPEELKTLYEHGLKVVYLGLESGDDEVLRRIDKGATSEDMIEAARKIRESGIKLSVTYILGLGGKALWEQHAINSAKTLNKMKPDYLGLLTLYFEEGAKIIEDYERGDLVLLEPIEVMEEVRLLVSNLELENCVFRSNHASNYVSISGTFPKDKKSIIVALDNIIKQNPFKKKNH